MVWRRRWGERTALAEAGLDCTVEVYMSEESNKGVTVIRQGGSSKSSEFGGKVVSTLDGPIWPHFQCTQSKEKRGQDWDECCRSSREGDEEGQEKGRRKEKEKTGDRF